MKRDKKPLTPCCQRPFVAVTDYSMPLGQLGLITHTKCKRCGKKYDTNLKPIL